MVIKDIFQALSHKRDIETTFFKKEFNENPDYLSQLQQLLEDTSGNINKKLVEEHVHLFKLGLIGESNVHYELKNSMLPMICLHDIRLKDGDNTAQFDFIAVTHSAIFVIETKKLYGDIEVNENGDFIRKYKNKYGKVVKKEGIYSPVTQSSRHARILRKLLMDKGLIEKAAVEPIVVLANPKSILEKRKAPKEIQERIIKSDQLVTYLSKSIEKYKKERFLLDKFVTQVSDFILENNQDYKLDTARYKLKNSVEEKKSGQVDAEEIGGKKEKLYEELKKFRLQQSKLANVKPYLIFYNSTLDEIVEKIPRSKEELLKVKGFGEVKVQKYGVEIVEIVKRYI